MPIIPLNTYHGTWNLVPRTPSPFRKAEFGIDGRTLYLYGRADTTMDRVNAWIQEIWVGKEETEYVMKAFGEIGTEQFRVMLQLPELPE